MNKRACQLAFFHSHRSVRGKNKLNNKFVHDWIVEIFLYFHDSWEMIACSAVSLTKKLWTKLFCCCVSIRMLHIKKNPNFIERLRSDQMMIKNKWNNEYELNFNGSPIMFLPLPLHITVIYCSSPSFLMLRDILLCIFRMVPTNKTTRTVNNQHIQRFPVEHFICNSVWKAITMLLGTCRHTRIELCPIVLIHMQHRISSAATPSCNVLKRIHNELFTLFFRNINLPSIPFEDNMSSAWLRYYQYYYSRCGTVCSTECSLRLLKM